MAMKLKDRNPSKNLLNVIDGHAKDVKSKAAPEGMKTFLLYIPRPLHQKLKIAATSQPEEIGLHDYIIKKLEELHG